LPRIGAKMEKWLGASLRFYRYWISPLFGNVCRFHPSCSEYAEEAFARFGLARGAWLSLRRVGKCHPWHVGGIDEVPPKD
jgi:putative membrane protein insertion efficiency factor